MYAYFMVLFVVGLCLYGAAEAARKKKFGKKYDGLESSKTEQELSQDEESEITDENLVAEINTIKNALSNAITLSGGSPERVKISFEKKLNLPEEFACFKKKSGWYYYSSDSRNRGLFRGPYDINTLIHVLAFRLPVEKSQLKALDDEFPSETFNSGDFSKTRTFMTEEQISKFEEEQVL